MNYKKLSHVKIIDMVLAFLIIFVAKDLFRIETPLTNFHWTHWWQITTHNNGFLDICKDYIQHILAVAVLLNKNYFNWGVSKTPTLIFGKKAVPRSWWKPLSCCWLKTMVDSIENNAMLDIDCKQCMADIEPLLCYCAVVYWRVNNCAFI